MSNIQLGHYYTDAFIHKLLIVKLSMFQFVWQKFYKLDYVNMRLRLC